MRHRLLIAALGASVLAHAAVLGSTAGFGRAHEPPVRPLALDARLVMPEPEPVAAPPAAEAPNRPAAVQPVAAPKPRPQAKMKRQPEVKPVAAIAPAGEQAVALAVPMRTPEPPSESVVDASAPSAAPEVDADALSASSADSVTNLAVEPAAQPVAAPADSRKFSSAGWPRRGDIRFRVMLGEPGFEVGEAHHEWSHDRKRYRMSVSLETTGVVDLFRKLRYQQHSEGRVGPKGLQPERFGVEQSGRKPESAEFDWQGGQVTMRRGDRTRTAPIEPGDQDVLSLWHQLGIVGVAGLPHELNVVSGKSAKRSVLEAVGVERPALPIGQLEALRVRARALDGKLSIDIWLARDYGMLPVRIRIVDDKGEVLDQQAVELRLAPTGKNKAANPKADDDFDGEPGGGALPAGDDVAQYAGGGDEPAAEPGAGADPDAPDAAIETDMIELREAQHEPASIYQ
ncbi:DUF3108 domain-containing protein [Aromatoleum sp.]|uniref:DUF3108 domain-containing protein n=1 Tax=Aromatoleum sp. TaxID=2307007 RepID=UPI002FC6C6C5